MNHCTLPTAIALHRPWWARAIDALRPRGVRGASSATPTPASQWGVLRAAIELNDATLRDIGAPEWLREEAAQRRAGDSIALRSARADLGGGGVRWMG